MGPVGRPAERGVRGRGVGRGVKSLGFSECCPLEAETWLHTVLQRQRGSQPEGRAASHTVLGSLLWPGRPTAPATVIMESLPVRADSL